MSKKIKLYCLLLLAFMGTSAQAGLGSWMREKAVRGGYYVWEAMPLPDKYARAAMLCAGGAALAGSMYVNWLKYQVRTKEERKKIEERYPPTIGYSDSVNTVYLGVLLSSLSRPYEIALRGESDATSMINGSSSGFIDTAFTSPQKQIIQSTLSSIGLDASRCAVKQVDGYGGSARGTSNGGIITVGKDIPNSELKYVVGHEAVHLKNNHQKKSALVACVIPIAVHAGCALLHWGAVKVVNHIQRAYGIKKGSKSAHVCSWIKASTKTLSKSWFFKLFLSFYFFNMHKRTQEKEADVESVQKLHNAQDGVNFLNVVRRSNLWYKINRGDYDMDNQGNYLGDLEHPSLTERIAYLTPLAEQQAHKR